MNILSSAAAAARHAASAVGEHVTPLVDAVEESARAHGSAFAAEVERSHLAAEVREVTTSVASAAGRFADEKRTQLRELEAEIKQKILRRIVFRLDQGIRIACGVVTEQLRTAVKPYDAPLFVQRWVDEVVDAVAPDAEAELREVLLSKACCQSPIPVLHDEAFDGACCGSASCCYSRWNPVAIIRYRVCPFDQTIWWQLRDPLWWFFFLVAMVPRYAIGQIVYLLWFLILDKSDEYQLLAFILDFKGLMFVNGGVLTSLVGLGQLYVCSVSDSCDKFAPMEQFLTVFVFTMQIITTWIAFALMACCAERKGGYAPRYDHDAAAQRRSALQDQRLQHATFDVSSSVDENAAHDAPRDVESITAGHASEAAATAAVEETSLFRIAAQELRMANEDTLRAATRGRLMWMLAYDVVAFAVCAGLIAWSATYNLLDPSSTIDMTNLSSLAAANWKFLLTVYVVRCLYGLLTFPFMILLIPGVEALVCHTRRTGYDTMGRTVPYNPPQHHQDAPVIHVHVE